MWGISHGYTSAPNSAIVSHYLLKGIFNTLVQEAGIDWISLWHRKPRGCFFDFCEVKEDLNLKLRTADICGDCLSVFQSIGIPDSLLAQTVTMMESTRRQALNTGQFLPPETVFSAGHFPSQSRATRRCKRLIPCSGLCCCWTTSIVLCATFISPMNW